MVKDNHQDEIFHLLVSQVRDYAIFVIDTEGRIMSWNAGAQHIKGYTENEVIGQSINLFYTEEDVFNGKPACNLELARQQGHFEEEGWRIRKDGSRFWASVVFTSLFDEEGGLKGYAKVTRDISEQHAYKKALEDKLEIQNRELNKNEKRFRSLLENNYDIIILLDSSFRIIYRSPSAERTTGWSTQELLDTDGNKHIHPDDLSSVYGVFKELMDNPGKPVRSLFRNRHKNGNYLWMEGISTNLLHEPDIQALVFNFRDVTERKISHEKLIKSEELYRNLFENLLHGFAYCKCDVENGILNDFIYEAVNQKYIELTGLKDIVGKKASQVLPILLDPDKENFKKISAVVFSGIPEQFETFIDSAGKWFAISLYSPEPDYFIALLDDISIAKEAEQKIHCINLELERKVALRTEELRSKNVEMEAFSYSVSHDLRAPLRGIIGFTTILEEEYSSKLDAEAQRLTAVIRKNTEKMGDLIDDLLAFSRVGKSEIFCTEIDSHGLVQRVIEDLENKNHKTQISWIIHPLHFMHGDCSLIRQVWINLISNAMKYSANRENPVIEISSGKNNGQLIFEIKDNGVGFDMKFVSKLFRVFQRLHGANEFEGTGVGLAIVEKIINRHGGKTWAESVLDGGASFYFSVPATAG